MQMLSTAQGWVAANLNKTHSIPLLLHVTLKGWKRRLKEWSCWALLVLFPQHLELWFGERPPSSRVGEHCAINAVR